MGGASEPNFEVIFEIKGLVDRICYIASTTTDPKTREEALVNIYNMCENHGSKYFEKVMLRNP